jgi:Tfp pilus assembly protein PilX
MMLRRQDGMTLIMGLIMLIVLTLLALTSFSLGKSNLIVVSNMQQRDQNIAAARALIEEVLSNGKFHETPANAVINPCDGPNSRCLDVNGDGVNDVTVRMATPICVKSRILKNTELNIVREPECFADPGSFGSGMENRPAGNSQCADSTWELNVTATDNLTAAAVTVTQGVAARVDQNEIKENCP